MKIKEGFLVKKVADDYIVIPYEDKIVDFKAMLVLNETGAFLWEELQKRTSSEELKTKLTSEFDVDEKTAEKDISDFLQLLKEKDLLENE